MEALENSILFYTQAEDLDRIVFLHKDYVSTVFDRCLLNKKVVLSFACAVTGTIMV